MQRKCNACHETFDDFNHSCVCPHDGFEPSESAKHHLRKSGICWKCGARNGAGECSVPGCPELS